VGEGISTRPSRRALLAAAGGAAAALAAESLARPLSAAAADHDSVKLGEVNLSSNETSIRYQRADAMVAPAFSVQSRNQGAAIHAEGDGLAVSAFSSQGTALMATVDGSGSQPAVQAECVNGPAVWGSSEAAPGVRGTGAVGISGESTEGIGVRAVSEKGVALKAEGPVQFSSSGLGTVLKGAASAKVVPLQPLSLRSKILVTLMSDPGRATLKYVRVFDSTRSRLPSYFVVYLVATAPANVRFAWFVIS
jgi:hypothetical protein